MKRKARRARLTTLLLAAALILPLSRLGHDARAQGDTPLELVTTIEVGGSPDAIVVDCCARGNDVVFYDRTAQQVRFIDGDTLTLRPEAIVVSTQAWEGWMAYDRYHQHTYVVTMDQRETDMRVGWKEVRVHVIAGQSLQNSFSVNEDYNTDPLSPQDRFHGLEGVALKQPMSEGNNWGRLIVDDTKNGNIDVVDLNALGTDAALRQRYSYRPSLCGESSCFSYGIDGNSLALETNHETLAVDDLTGVDLLYIADPNHTQGHMRALQLDQPLGYLNAVPLPDVVFTSPEFWPLSDDYQGIAMSDARDRLYVASGQQSFDTGYLAQVDTTVNQPDQLVTIQYGDEGFVHVDWYDANRAFVAAYDGFSRDPYPPLYLHLLYKGAVVDTLRLVEDYDDYGSPLRNMVFDPYYRRLYLTVGSTVMVVQVDYGAGPASPPPIVASAPILPGGGSLIAPGSRALLDFPAGAVDQTTVVTYTETALSPTGSLRGVRFFDLSAVISGTTTPVTSFNKPYTMTLNYTDAENGAAIEDTLRLHWWNGHQWVPETTSSLNAEQNQLTATPDHMTLFAVLGETNRLYLPLALRSQ